MTLRVSSRGSDQFPLRMPDGMRDHIKEQAAANGRSMNTEIISRLEASAPIRKGQYGWERGDRCDNCRYANSSGQYTICRRYPRQAGDFFVVNDDAWCGEYTPNGGAS